jgi:hypothetical protein
MKEKKSRWEEDCVVVLSRDARAKLKIKSALRGISIKALLEEFANIK